MFPTEVLLGPLAALALAIIAAAELYRSKKKTDAEVLADVRKQRDDAMAGWREQTEATREQATATNRLADELARK